MTGLVCTRLLSSDNVVELHADGSFGFRDDTIVRIRNEHKRLLLPFVTLSSGQHALVIVPLAAITPKSSLFLR